MAQTSPRPTTSAATGSTVPRPRVETGRRWLLIAVAMVIVGSFLPWIDTAVGNVAGYRGGGIWTFYVSMLGFTGAFLPWRRVAAAQALVMAVVCVALPVWQVARLLDLVGTAGWIPGSGLVLVLLGGVVAAMAAVRLWRPLR